MMTIRPARISRGAIIGGQFRLERLLGQGGMSVVWAARDLQSGRPVAVKLLGPEAMAKPRLRQRFAREARITSRIRSPHVAQIFADGVTSAGVPFVAMELLEGESLAAHLAHVGRCSLVTTGAVLEQVCRALSSAHVVGLVHRDVKPANIFLTQQPHGELVVRLLDFGLAKELLFGASGLRQSGELLGTADYMSPEQLCSPESVSSASDIWSLGVVLYEMLTGKRPFDENTFPLLALRIAEGSFLPPSRVCPDLPKAVDAVVAGALAPDEKQRYATAAELGSAFLRVVRTHCSDSIVRPHVLRVLQAYDERLPANHPSQDAVPVESVSCDDASVRERWLSLLLVGLCIAVVFTSWLAASTLDDEHAETARSAATARAAETSAAAASAPPLSAATEANPAALPPPASPAAPLLPPSAAESANPTPPLTGSPGATYLPPTAAAVSDLSAAAPHEPGVPPLIARQSALAIQAPAALTVPSTQPAAARVPLPSSGLQPQPPLPSVNAPNPFPRKPVKPKRVDKPAQPQITASEEGALEAPPRAAAPLSRESKYGF